MTKRTTSEAEIRALIAEGLNFVQIAEKTGVNVQSLRQCACCLGIASPYRKSNASTADEYIALIAQGQTAGEIAKAYGLTPQSVYLRLKRAGLPTTPAEYLKSQHPTARMREGSDNTRGERS